MSEEKTTIQPAHTQEENKPLSNAVSSLTQTENKADAKLIEFITMYTTGLVAKVDSVRMSILSMILIAIVTAGYVYFSMQDIKAESVKQTMLIERMDKRHWELSKVIELSQERSARKKAETENGKDQTDMP